VIVLCKCMMRRMVGSAMTKLVMRPPGGGAKKSLDWTVFGLRLQSQAST
jgi:hypothetical protein